MPIPLTPPYCRTGQPPIVVFVCHDDLLARRFCDAADHHLLAHRAEWGRPAQRELQRSVLGRSSRSPGGAPTTSLPPRHRAKSRQRAVGPPIEVGPRSRVRA
jgi:hypothetical protein